MIFEVNNLWCLLTFFTHYSSSKVYFIIFVFSLRRKLKMVKLSRGGMNNSNRGRLKLRPLFPPGELPLFGPPPVYIRRPGPPIPPTGRGPVGYEYGPHPPPMRPPRMGPPPNIHMRGHPGRPPPPMPLLQAPVMPPRPLSFMRGRGMGPRMGPGKNFGKGIKKPKNRRSKKNVPSPSVNKQDVSVH